MADYMVVLAVDVGGSGVKFRLSTSDEVRRFPSGPDLTAEAFVDLVKRATADWDYHVLSIGYPGAVAGGIPVAEPGNLGPGWVGHDFRESFNRPVRLVNDAILHALGAYRSGRMLYLGFGTGVGSALVSEHVLVPLELGCLPHPHGGMLVDHLGRDARKQRGHAQWQSDVIDLVPRLRAALAAEYVVLGGGNGRKVNPLPPHTYREGDQDAFEGGVRLWEEFVEPHDAEPSRNWRVVR